MSAKKTGLGRSFASLIPTELLDESFDPTAKQDEQVSDLRQLKISEIVPDPDQPRRNFDDMSLDELAASIKEHGILQPIVVVPHELGYMIVAGERRYRAAIRAKLEKIPALVRTLSAQHKLEVSLVENLQRHDLNPLETATAYLKLRDQFNLTLDQIGSRVGGRSVAAISNTLRLLRLPQGAREALANGQIREGQVRPLINLPHDVVEKIVPLIIAEEWSARMVEEYASKVRIEPKQLPPKVARPIMGAAQVARVTQFGKRLGAKVRLTQTARGSGSIVIPYKNDTDFERLLKLLER
ncbi:MAG: ParB/RepB/Spo0J family partition protein [Candidatus Saccharimonas sp.]